MALAIIAAPLSSCSFVRVKPPTPEFVEDNQPSWDGNEQNSGIIDFTDEGYLITPAAAKRYVWLTENYASGYTPPLESGMGLTARDDGNFNLSIQGMVEFMVLNQQMKSGIRPEEFKRNEVKE